MVANNTYINKNLKILVNKKAYFNYFIKEKIEAGILLQGWEIKSIRLKKFYINDAYIIIRNNEAYLLGSKCEPLPSIDLCVLPDVERNRKLLLHKHEIDYMYGMVHKSGYTLIATSLYWKKTWCKLEIGIVKGKKKKDKRENEKNISWKREQSRILKMRK